MKKILALLCIFTLCIAMAAGCGKKGNTKETTGPAENQSSESQAESSSEAETAVPETVNTERKTDDKYFSWTREDWDAASDEEKDHCILTYYLELMKIMGQEVAAEDREALIAAMNEKGVALRAEMEGVFGENAGLTVQEILERADELQRAAQSEAEQNAAETDPVSETEEPESIVE